MPKSEDLLRPMFNMSRLVTGYKFYLSTMKKKVLLAVLLLSGMVMSTFADDVGEASPNAVCVTLKSGEAEFAAFTDSPKILSADGKLSVVSESDSKQLILADLNNVEKINAVNHDFSTGIVRMDNEGTTATEVYNLDGTRATTIMPGRVYIIKSNGTTKKVIK